jgi:beta-lactamase regulating signal transducer with metallopeptidase domain/Leucine-rich repeat (LRR) protein/5-hydroxyisourate hydrolase-like protein (transthyretin family)
MSRFLLHSAWADRIGWTLVHSLWQFALVALVAIVLRRAMQRRSAAARYGALLVAMVIMVAMPVATWFSPWLVDAPAVAVKPEQPVDDLVNTPPQPTDDPLPMAAMPLPSAVEPAEKPQAEPAALQPLPIGPHAIGPHAIGLHAIGLASAWSVVKGRVQPWLPLIVLLWLAGVLVVAMRLLLSWHNMHRLRKAGVSPAGGSVQGVLERTAEKLKLARAVEVLQSTLVRTPVVVGYFRPLILLPACVVTGLPAGQLEMILAHEMAHIRRHDYLVNLLQTLVETLFFYHPAVWWLSRQIRNERENCCDDVAMGIAGSRADYGRALLAVEELRAVSPSLSLAASGGSLLARIRRIAGCEPAPRVAGGGILSLMLISTAILMAVTWGTAPAAEKPKADQQPNESSLASPAMVTQPAEAQRTQLAPRDADAEGYTGTVVEKGSGKPIAGATVTVHLTGKHPPEVVSRYETDDAGKFRLTIPPERAADENLDVGLEVTHPNYEWRGPIRYPLSQIRRNAKLGDRPIEPMELAPGEAITGTVVLPDGRPAADVQVHAISSLAGYWRLTAPVSTDAHGVFRVNLIAGADFTLCILPQEYALSFHELPKKRGDVGRFALDRGIKTKGRVVDEQGRPVAGVSVKASIVRSADHGTARMVVRAGVTDRQGEFALSPLAAGEYFLNVQPNVQQPPEFHPLPAAFGPQKLTLKQGEKTVFAEVHALPSVCIEGQLRDSRGKPLSRPDAFLSGIMPGKTHADPTGSFFMRAAITNGTFMFHVPKGLQWAALNLATGEYDGLRVRLTKDSPLTNRTNAIDLGTPKNDIRGIDVTCYEVPLLLVKPVSSDGKVIEQARLRFSLDGFERSGGPFIDGRDRNYQRQADGRLRSRQLDPDKEFTVTVSADGYLSKSETLSLPEGAVKELEVKLKPIAGAGSDAAKTSVASPDGNPENTLPARAAHEKKPAEAQRTHLAPPLPPGEYVLNAATFQRERRKEQGADPTPAVFGPQRLTLKQGENAVSVELRGLPMVCVEGQCFDRHGKPHAGHLAALSGIMPGKPVGDPLGRFQSQQHLIDDGKFTLRGPKGLQRATLLVSGGDSSLRVRVKKDGPLVRAAGGIDLGTLESDLRGIEAVCYDAPTLIVKAVGENGKVIEGASLIFNYDSRAGYRRQSDGRLRSAGLLPDEEFTVTVIAAGYQSKSETLTLPEGAVKELEVKLKLLAAAGGDAGKSSAAHPADESSPANGHSATKGEVEGDSQPAPPRRRLKADPNTDEGRAIAELEKMGGAVWAYEGSPANQPILVVCGPKMTDTGLEHLKGLPQLRSLNLFAAIRVTDAGLVNLDGLSQLRTLNLMSTKVTDEGLKHLKGLSQLQSLNLIETPIGDAGLVNLKGLTQLQTLDLACSEVTDAGLAHLAGLTHLQTLRMSCPKTTDAGLVFLEGLTELQLLSVSGMQVTDAGLAHLEGLKTLKSLTLGYTKVTDAGLAHLKGLTQLKMLSLMDTSVTDAGLG